MSIEFLLTSLIIVASPGTGAIYTIAAGLTRGPRASVIAALACTLGILPHLMAALMGIAAVLHASALAFTVVKYAGVAYLVYLGIKAFLEKSGSLDLPAAQMVSPMQAFRQGLFTEILNPKTALFFLAFLPQFIHPESGSVIAQFSLLGIIFVGLSICVTSVLAIAAGSVRGWLGRNRSIGRWQGKVIGSIYMALGVRLAFQQQ